MAQIESVHQQALSELAQVKSLSELEQFRVKYLGSKGEIKNLMKLLAKVPKEQKPSVGERANSVQDDVNSKFEEKKAQLASTAAQDVSIDVTEPGARPQIGRKHILMQVVDELVELFGRMGFSVATGPEVEDEFHNFVALNIPESHPARDPLDNFYLQPATGESSEVRGQSSGRRLIA